MTHRGAISVSKLPQMNNAVGVITSTALFIRPHNELANFDTVMMHTCAISVSKLPQMNNAVGVIHLR